MKRIVSLFLTLLMLTTLIACSAPKEEERANALPETTTYPITLTDAAGRSVVIEDEPQ